ncbi:c-type cytochrome [Aestuariirhabdus litorea]|uniref:Cytochrome c4 n=1 Tax=Aestuariirhabdus litorea TaxID=2528527 RepID=A0A3P3VP08_9GAMM|nr:c-type cytochrome [Aestuariirhabdus litorea]RRJ82553.1 cytochrome c4 [Aestuariirhabdus litorea]RWW92713.1 c-type cytochrome [Endozoicomonadaceae bacterium GTF-13]
MKKVIVSLMLTLGVSTGAQAAGDATAGQAKAALCGACHGANGVSAAPNFPNLAAQGERYLVKQMNDIKSGERTVVEMTGMLNALSEQDFEDIAAYYASKPAATGAADPKLVQLGESIYRGGNSEKGIPACNACHSPTGKGNAQAGFPALSGQKSAYTAKQLRAFREGERTNDGDTRIMRDIAEKLSNKEVDALASFIEGLR